MSKVTYLGLKRSNMMVPTHEKKIFFSKKIFFHRTPEGGLSLDSGKMAENPPRPIGGSPEAFLVGKKASDMSPMVPTRSPGHQAPGLEKSFRSEKKFFFP